jgi:hypothetical protein
MPRRSAVSTISGVTDLDSRRWGWWGFVFTAAFVASLVAGGALAVGKTLYLPGASAAQLRDFYSANGLAVGVQSGLQAVAAVLLGQAVRTPTMSTATNLAIASAVAVTTYLVIVALSVLKPWGRIRR